MNNNTTDNKGKENDAYATYEQIKQLKQDIITPHKFAEIFKTAISESKVLDETLTKKTEEAVDKYNKGKRNAFILYASKGLWTLLMFLSGFLLNKFL